MEKIYQEINSGSGILISHQIVNNLIKLHYYITNFAICTYGMNHHNCDCLAMSDFNIYKWNSVQ